MPSQTIEEFLKKASPETIGQVKEQGQVLQTQGAAVKSEYMNASRQAEQVSSREGNLSQPVAAHLASHDRAKQGNAVNQALQANTYEKGQEPEKAQEREQSKGKDLER